MRWLNKYLPTSLKVSLQNLVIRAVFPTLLGPAVTRVTLDIDNTDDDDDEGTTEHPLEIPDIVSLSGNTINGKLISLVNPFNCPSLFSSRFTVLSSNSCLTINQAFPMDHRVAKMIYICS